MKIYNSLSRKKDPFEPPKDTEVGMYVCGPTVYDEPHIGHARSAYIFDVIRRYLKYKGYKVKFVRNVTDVDDKIIDKAKEEFKGENLNSAVKKVASKYLSAYHSALDRLGISREDPDVNSDIIEPKASEYIDKMKGFIKILIDKKVAYQSGADVYFDITKAKNYGKLSHQSIEAMEVGARVTPTENKRHPLDFALWKSAKEDEPFWDSDWGKGRPGWHIECSVMSTDILGDEFDIHGGGLDLIFPHHENEIAQAKGAGKKFARFWIHHGLLTINGQKMAKSLGNFISIKDFLKEYKYPNILKFFFLSSHYRNPIDYTKKRIEEARSTNERLFIMLNKVQDIFSHIDFTKKEKLKKNSIEGKFKYILGQFENAMDDDFNTPLALARLQQLITDANITITKYSQITYHDISLQELYDSCYIILPKIASVFGLDLNIPPEMGKYLNEEVDELIKKRDEARKDGNFKLADKIREELSKEGIFLEDKDGKTEWRRRL